MYIEQFNNGNIYILVLKRAFDAFAQDKGYIEANMVGTILQMLGHDVSEDRLQEIIAEVDADGKSFKYYIHIYNYKLIKTQVTNTKRLSTLS